MTRRVALLITLFVPVAITGFQAQNPDAQTRPGAAAAGVPRAIRRDVPLTNAIRRAHDSGTRDMTGRPARQGEVAI